MNKKFLILFPCVAMVLAACGGGNSSSKTSSAGPAESSNNDPVSSSVEAEKVESVEISKQAITLDIGGFEDLRATAKPGTLSDKSVVWTTTNDKVATVSDQGRVTAVGAGTATIRAASKLDATKYAECVVTVNNKRVFAYCYTPEIGVEYRLGTYQGNLGKMIYADALALESQRMNSVANFNDAGKYVFENGSGAGKYHVARVNGTTKEYLNTVSSDDYHFVFEATAKTDWEWDEAYCTIKTLIGTTANNYYFPGTYNSYETISSCSIAQVLNDFVGHFYVAADVANPTSVTIYPNQNVEIYAGASIDLQARILPLGATESKVTWSSSNDKVTVVDGHVVADPEATGTAKITAKVTDTVKADVTLTVKEKLNYGTEQAPLTVDQAIELIDKIGGKITDQNVYVKGTVSESSYSSSYKNYTIWLSNATNAKAYEIYGGVMDESIKEDYTAANALKGKEIVVRGLAKKYNTTYEHTYDDAKTNYPTILSVKEAAAVEATGITLSKTEAEVAQGGSLTLTATLIPGNATTAVVWSVADNDDVTVDQKGKVTVAATAVGGSKATVKATAGKVSATCVITVTAKTINYGTIEAPLTIAEAKELIDTVPAKTIMDQELVVAGEVFSSSYSSQYKNYTIWLTDGATDKAFELYAAVMDASITTDYTANDALKGKTVVCKGYGENYNGTYEVTKKGSGDATEYPTIYKVTDTVADPFGTAAHPLTIAQAKALIDTVPAKTIMDKELYVTGEVATSSYNSTYKNYTIWLKDGDNEKAFELYAAVMDASITTDYTAADALKGMTVVCRGYGENYNGTYEVTKKGSGDATEYPTILKVTGGVAPVVNYGTATNPLTIAQAKALIDTVPEKTIMDQELYVTGEVFSSSYNSTYKNYTIWLKDGATDKAFELYAAVMDASITTDYTAADALKGMTVVCRGYGENYNGTYEVTKKGSGDATEYPTILKVSGSGSGQGTGDDGGQSTDGTVLKLTNSAITVIDETKGATSYARFNGSRVVNGYTVETTDVLSTTWASLSVMQVKKGTGSLKISNIKATKVHFVMYSSFDSVTDENVIKVNFAGTDYNFSASDVSTAWGAKVATGTKNGNYDVYKFELEATINASAAGLLTITGATNGANYIGEIAIY